MIFSVLERPQREDARALRISPISWQLFLPEDHFGAGSKGNSECHLPWQIHLFTLSSFSSPYCVGEHELRPGLKYKRSRVLKPYAFPLLRDATGCCDTRTRNIVNNLRVVCQATVCGGWLHSLLVPPSLGG